MRIDPRTRFSPVADLYDRFRPDYPDTLMRWLLARAALSPGACVADVGCGTGIATRQLRAHGLRVIGLDPNAAMLGHARRDDGPYLRATSTATGLRSRSIDLITVGQAFHWFDVAATLDEFARVLRPHGLCAAFWNLRAHTPFLDGYDALLRVHCRGYEERPIASDTMQAIERVPVVANVERAQFRHAQLLDRRAFLGRVHSSSYVEPGVRDPVAFDRALGALHERHQKEGRIEFAYRTVALTWHLVATGAPAV